MKLFDLHCDTVTEAFRQQKPLDAFTLPFRTMPYEKWAQTIAFFLNDTLREHGWMYLQNARAYFDAERRRTCPQFADWDAPDADFRFLPAVENCGWICGDEARVDALAQMGMKMLSLCWNGDNPLCGGSHGDGRGLSEQGRRVLRRMRRLRLVTDVSHASDATFDDLCRMTDEPFVATHSNARALCGHRRNLSDDRIRELCRRGGLIGVNFYTAFLHETQTERPYELVCAHLERIFSLGGERCSAIGSDFDGAVIAPELRENLCGLYEAVRERFGKEQADRVFYDNAQAFFSRFWAEK